jgi:hypothetical protein
LDNRLNQSALWLNLHDFDFCAHRYTRSASCRLSPRTSEKSI